jgi:hypothetical protein
LSFQFSVFNLQFSVKQRRQLAQTVPARQRFFLKTENYFSLSLAREEPCKIAPTSRLIALLFPQQGAGP